MKYGALIALLAASTVSVWGQNEEDVFRYSQLESLGSVRSMAMGGAYGALGADLSVLTGNPSGLGLYRRGDVGITTGIASQRTKIRLESQLGTENQLHGAVTNIGIALSYPNVNPEWPVATLAVTHSKRANFHRTMAIEDVDMESSLLNTFLAQAQGHENTDLNNTWPYTAGLSWDTYLIDPAIDGNPTSYVSAIPIGGTRTSKTVEEEGFIGETNIGFGAGFKETLFLGVTLGIVNVDFEQTTDHHETPRVDSLSLIDWTYRENLIVEGSGVNFKAGLTFVATSWLRLGLAYHTRSRLMLTENYSTRITSAFKDGLSHEASSPINRFEYVILTPARWIASAAFILGKNGVISADYERINYASGRLKPSGFSGSEAYQFTSENEALQDAYGMSHITRVGAEFRLFQTWRLRFGTGMETTPYTPEANIQSQATRYLASTGVGYRSQKWYAGISYRRSWHEHDLYLFDGAEIATVGRTHSMVMFSLGARL